MENLAYLESTYARYRSDPHSVPGEWQDYFQVNGFVGGKPGSNSNSAAEPLVRDYTLDEKLHRLINHYRWRGHLIAALDPLGTQRPCPAELKVESYHFSESELNQPVNLPNLHLADTPLTIRELLERLKAIYCGSIGLQFMHIDDPTMREWLQRRMENPQRRPSLSRNEQLRILTRLTDATIFDEFLRKKFPGAKTFSLEGCETLLPLLDLAIERAGDQGVRDIVLGMAHRGRLNVLAHIAGKNPCEIFREFADAEPELWQGRGDVKYHLGHSAEWLTAGGRKVHLSLCFNPSHLEFISPVVLGRTRARQDRTGDQERREVLSLLIHGDAAFAGEGIVAETLNLGGLEGYCVGGTIHIILNNQIGFTTSPGEGRSTSYATDVACMLPSPIFHVNGEDAEAVAHTVRLALDFRHEFQRDVFIDMHGYRRWGHNETDEPSFTQPVLYRAIEHRKSVRENYLANLLKSNGVRVEEAEQIGRERLEKLEQQLAAAKQDGCAGAAKSRGLWENYSGGPEPEDDAVTSVSASDLSELLRKLAEVPESFHLHPKLERAMKLRQEMAAGKQPLDWAAAELLALAALAVDGVNIRLTGQDTARGTFSHRHAVFFDHQDGFAFTPLRNISSDQAPVEIVNSPLSEAGALGFEYGYSLDCPAGLILWEAQFGDFVNAAQVILDQFLASAEDKWARLSGLVLLLPHGFEGMGAEHSSARLERFLALAAEDNIQIAQPTTPAQYFHLLRRQALRKWRKPLIILTPKSLLRHPKVLSNVADFTQGTFQRLLPDAGKPEAISRILLCTGKIYYELLAYREENGRHDTALIRLEQLYPLPAAALEKMLQAYPAATPVLWVQEEPVNMGAWRFLHEKFGRHLFGRQPFAVAGRPESASPATGSSGAHKLEQRQLIDRAFSKVSAPVAAKPIQGIQKL